MSRACPTLLFLLLLLAVPGCGVDDPSHGDDGHVHGDPGSAGERPSVAVTHWTDRTELFMEYPAFVAGQSGRSAIHLTDLTDFSPLREGEAVVALRAEDGQVLRFRGGPSRPGIFGVDLEAYRPGVYQMTLRVEAPGLSDLHELGPVIVHPTGKLPVPDDAGEAEAISFLKEQQWTLEFGTTRAAPRGIRPGIAVPAILEPRPDGDARLTSPVPGRVDPAGRIPLPGGRVRAGELLARIAPRSDDLRDAAGLRAALVEAEQNQLLAARDRDRAARLVEARAVPSRRLDDAEAALTASEARLRAARERFRRYESLSGQAGEADAAAMFAIHAPFDGVVSEVHFTPGGSVEANELLMRVVDPDRLHVLGAVTESHAGELATVTAGELLLEGQPPLPLGVPLAINPVVDPRTRTTSVRFELDNRGLRLRVGQAARVRLYVGEEESVTAIPESSVVDDGGRPVVFVQTGGETFERRPVQLGHRGDGFVEVVEGVEAGERVVDRGAYLVRLAAMSTQIPAHGHVH